LDDLILNARFVRVRYEDAVDGSVVAVIKLHLYLDAVI
jgi:hypothetical protein